MAPKIDAKYSNFSRLVTLGSGRLYARVISWFSADNLAARAFMMIALGVPAGTTFWTLAASSILHRTQR